MVANPNHYCMCITARDLPPDDKQAWLTTEPRC